MCPDHIRVVATGDDAGAFVQSGKRNSSDAYAIGKSWRTMRGHVGQSEQQRKNAELGTRILADGIILGDHK